MIHGTIFRIWCFTMYLKRLNRYFTEDWWVNEQVARMIWLED